MSNWNYSSTQKQMHNSPQGRGPQEPATLAETIEMVGVILVVIITIFGGLYIERLFKKRGKQPSTKFFSPADDTTLWTFKDSIDSSFSEEGFAEFVKAMISELLHNGNYRTLQCRAYLTSASRKSVTSFRKHVGTSDFTLASVRIENVRHSKKGDCLTVVVDFVQSGVNKMAKLSMVRGAFAGTKKDGFSQFPCPRCDKSVVWKTGAVACPSCGKVSIPGIRNWALDDIGILKIHNGEI